MPDGGTNTIEEDKRVTEKMLGPSKEVKERGIQDLLKLLSSVDVVRLDDALCFPVVFNIVPEDSEEFEYETLFELDDIQFSSATIDIITWTPNSAEIWVNGDDCPYIIKFYKEVLVDGEL